MLLILAGLPLWKLASADDLFDRAEHPLGRFALHCLFILTCVAMVVVPILGLLVLTS